MLADEQVQFKGNIPTELASFLNLNLIELSNKLSQSSSIPDKARVEMVNGEIRIILPAGNFKLMGADGILNNSFNNTDTNLTSTNIQDAVVEVNAKVTQTDNAVSSLGDTVSSIQNQVDNLPAPSNSLPFVIEEFEFTGDYNIDIFTFTHTHNSSKFDYSAFILNTGGGGVYQQPVSVLAEGDPDEPLSKINVKFTYPPNPFTYRVIFKIYTGV